MTQLAPSALFLEKLRRRTAQAAIGPSALRNQGAPGVIAAARSVAEAIDLSRYSTRYGKTKNCEDILSFLDEDTNTMLAQFPQSAQSWGAARKGLNLFLRDASYNVDLSREFELVAVRSHLEVPLDRHVGEALRYELEGAELPHWGSIKMLQPAASAEYQKVALQVAKRFGVARVDLDVFFWRSEQAR